DAGPRRGRGSLGARGARRGERPAARLRDREWNLDARHLERGGPAERRAVGGGRGGRAGAAALRPRGPGGGERAARARAAGGATGRERRPAPAGPGGGGPPGAGAPL